MNLNATLFGQAIAFVLFVLFCMKYIWPPLMAAIETRQQRIAEGLSLADEAKRSMELAKSEAAIKIKQAHDQAQTIVEKATKHGAQLVDDAKNRALQEHAHILARARMEIEVERQQLKEQICQQSGALAIMIAEKLIAHTINTSIDQNIIKQFLFEVETDTTVI